MKQKNPTSLQRLIHEESDSCVIMRVEKEKGRIIIKETAFLKGNVISLPAVRSMFSRVLKEL